MQGERTAPSSFLFPHSPRSPQIRRGRRPHPLIISMGYFSFTSISTQHHPCSPKTIAFQVCYSTREVIEVTTGYYLTYLLSQALEQRVWEMEEDNQLFRQALSLPPSNRSPLGRGPTSRDLPSQVERFRRQTTFPNSGSSASPDTISSTPRSLTASIPARTTTMVRTVPSQQKNSILLIRHQALSEDHPEQGESPPQSIMPPAQMCSSLSSPSNQQELEPPPLHSRIFHLPDAPTIYLLLTYFWDV